MRQDQHLPREEGGLVVPVSNGHEGRVHEGRPLFLHQIYYQAPQLNHLDPAFIPYCNVANPRPEWCEYHVFRSAYHAGSCCQGITGFVSWKFSQKTGVTGAAFREWILANPGHDVYFINPFPQLVRKRRPNVWYQGDRYHPGISAIAQELFERLGYDIDLRALRMGEKEIAYCNYWAGTPAFWGRYMAFCEPFHDLIENGLDDENRAKLLRRADAQNDICYIPYLFERLFSTLLCLDESIRAVRMRTPKEARLTWGHWIRRELSRPYRRLFTRRV